LWRFRLWLSRGAEPPGHFYKVSKRVGIHLFHDLAPVDFDSDFADAEFGADLFVQEAGDDQSHDLAFAFGEGGVAVSEFAYLGFVIKGSTAVLDGVADGVYPESPIPSAATVPPPTITASEIPYWSDNRYPSTALWFATNPPPFDPSSPTTA
jgi:hypothetical protein